MDLTIRTNPVGGIEVSAIIDNHRVHRTYYGFTKPEAAAHFKEVVNV